MQFFLGVIHFSFDSMHKYLKKKKHLFDLFKDERLMIKVPKQTKKHLHV